MLPTCLTPPRGPLVAFPSVVRASCDDARRSPLSARSELADDGFRLLCIIRSLVSALRLDHVSSCLRVFVTQHPEFSGVLGPCFWTLRGTFEFNRGREPA